MSNIFGTNTNGTLISNNSEFHVAKPKEKNLAEVYYSINNEEDFIRIEKFENFYTRKEISNKYGHTILKKYSNSDPQMYKICSKCIELISDKESWYSNIKQGDKYTKKEFENIVSIMKQAGHNFVEIIKENKHKIKSVEI